MARYPLATASCASSETVSAGSTFATNFVNNRFVTLRGIFGNLGKRGKVRNAAVSHSVCMCMCVGVCMRVCICVCVCVDVSEGQEGNLSSSSSLCNLRFFKFWGPPMIVVSCLRAFFFCFCLSSSDRKYAGISVRCRFFCENLLTTSSSSSSFSVSFSLPLLRFAGGVGVFASEREVEGVVEMKAIDDCERGEAARRGERGPVREESTDSGEGWGEGE